MAFVIVVTVALLVIATVTIINVLTLRRLRPTLTATTEQPLVSIMIPARNEAAVIEPTVRALLRQNYPNFEVIVLDDNSTDATSEKAQAAGGGRVKVLHGQPLPDGWLGKNWACQQMAAVAQGDILVFTDADVRWEPTALSAIIAEMQDTEADLLTVWPTQITQTWGERLVVPLMAFAIVGYLPLPLVHHSPFTAFAAANGQCLAFRRTAYDNIGGHRAVHDNIVEDVALAQRIKAAGLRLRMADGAGEILCRMYSSWTDVRDGFAKNILAGHGNSIVLLSLSTLFHWALFILPWLWLLLDQSNRLWAAALIAIGFGVRSLSATTTRQRGLDSLLMPVSVLLMSRIALQAVWWRYRYGGPRWKNRTINQPETAHG